MSDWNSCLRSVLTCCLVCAIVLQLVSDTGTRALVRILCAMLTAVSLAKPLARTDWTDLLRLPRQTGADACILEGEAAAREAKAVCIRQVTETYILEKAKTLGAQIGAVTITLNEDLLPAFAEIHGSMDQRLQQILETDLGIPKEQQTWIWNRESSKSDS